MLITPALEGDSEGLPQFQGYLQLRKRLRHKQIQSVVPCAAAYTCKSHACTVKAGNEEKPVLTIMS